MMLLRFNLLRINNFSPILPQLGYAKMPKQKKTKHTPTTIAQDKVVATGPVTLTNGDINIKVLAKPGAKQNTITDLSPDGVGVQIAAPPREGEANTELCHYIASVLGIKKSAVTLDKGSKSRNKTILLSGTQLTVEEVTTKLKQEKENS